MATTWRVLRHGGQPADTWRTLFEGAEAEAWQRFRAEAAALRHGWVVIQNADGETVAQRWAPRPRRTP